MQDVILQLRENKLWISKTLFNKEEKLDAVREKLCFEWFDKSTSLKKAYLQGSIDYLNVNYQNIKLPVVEGAESLRVKIYIEEALMCDVELDIGKGEVY